MSRKIPKTLSGIETAADRHSRKGIFCRKIPKTLSGIETKNCINIWASPKLSRKIPKTLSGIETCGLITPGPVAANAGKYLKPYQGLKFYWKEDYPGARYCRKIPKTLSGIETDFFISASNFGVCRKIPKTLSGIETCQQCEFMAGDLMHAGKYLKPYQGLKLFTIGGNSPR